MIRTAITVAATTTLLIARPSTLTKAMATTTASNSKLPNLKGVVFDMDDTLVRSNLDIRAMYKEIFGIEPSENFDILKDIADMKSPDEKKRAFEIIEEIEKTSRQQMTLMPGCSEVLAWLSHHQIPRALVTRNSQTTADAFCQKLPSEFSFQRAITRDDEGIPPKPDPTAMKVLANDVFGCEASEILMVGDSVANDVVFGKNSGTQTALLVQEADETSDTTADISVTHLTQLPKLLWRTFSINGPLGNTPEANQHPLHGSPPPQPQSELCVAAANGNIDAVYSLLENDSNDKPEEANGNTALIWACETGNAEIAKILLECRAKNVSDDKELASYVNHRGFLGATALNRASRRGHTNILKVLLDLYNNVNMDLPNSKLQYPLHFAAFKKNPEALQYLLEKGANPWVLDRKGRTPLEDTSCETCKSMLREAMK